MPNTIKEFIKLVSGIGDQTEVKNLDLFNFLMAFNMERPLKFVSSVQANYLRWNDVPMRQSHRAPVLLHLNGGTRTLSFTGIESRLPRELKTRGSFIIKAGEVRVAQARTVLCPFGTELFMISIESSVGHLTFQLDPMLSIEEWHTLQEFFHYIFQVLDKVEIPPKILNATDNDDNNNRALLIQTKEPNQIMSENHECTVQLESGQPVKAMVSSSSQDISVNCLEPMVFLNQEKIEACDQSARQSAVIECSDGTIQLDPNSDQSARQSAVIESSNATIQLDPNSDQSARQSAVIESSNATIQLDPNSSSTAINENLVNEINDIVGSTCDGKNKDRTAKRRASSNNESSKQKRNNTDSGNEACLSSSEIETYRRETRSLSRTRTQNVPFGEFKAPKQQRRGGGRGRGRGRSMSLASMPESRCAENVSGLNEATASNLSQQVSADVDSVPTDPFQGISDASSVMMEHSSQQAISSEVQSVPVDSFPNNSNPENEVTKVSSMPTLETPYASPQHEFSSEVEPKLISLCDNGDSQPILKSHENLLVQLEQCEAIQAGPTPAISQYITTNYLDMNSSNQPSLSQPSLEVEHKKVGSDIESDTSLLDSAVESAVLLPLKYASASATSPAPEREGASTDGEMDPLRLEEGTFV
ncbi:Glycogen synthase [Frankliniella fusca]|uniref:Glycogen synthase n=1 Tax=Frankliniella fusca TaxID=407009 RepID=A0AAE1I1K3_9NEOP|nr:Glycogen synthase [Frankliniella fusca]